jgi:integrase
MSADRNLWKRDGTWYVRARVHGVQLVKSLGTTDQREARRLRAVTLRDWNRMRFIPRAEMVAALAAQRVAEAPAPKVVTGERLLEVYQAIAEERRLRVGKPSAATVTNNVSAFRRVFGDGDGDVRARLTRDVLQAYAARMMAVLTDSEDEVALRRARVSVAGNVAQARSVVAEWTVDEYRRRGIALPALAEFRAVDVVTAEMPKYRLTEERVRLRLATEAAAATLQAARSPLFLVYVLAYFGGLRAGEIEQVRWTWLTRDAAGACWLVIPDAEANWTVKSKGGSVRLSVDVWEALQGYRGESEYVLPGATPTKRDQVLRNFSAWMRTVGWDRRRYSKTTHELRKLAGARWYTQHGLQIAAKWLRDNPQTVFRFYADLDPAAHPEPEGFVMDCGRGGR